MRPQRKTNEREESNMLNYDEFRKEVQSRVKEFMSEDFQNANITLHETLKNNSHERKGITVQREGISISPTIYLEEFYKSYENGKSMDDVLGKIGDFVEEVSYEEEPKEVYDLQDFSKMQDKVICKLINQKMNRRFLETVPWTKVNDLVEVYMVELDCHEGGSATMSITNSMQNRWEISTEKLHELALDNLSRMHPPVLSRMADVIEELLSGENPRDAKNLLGETKDASDFMYVLTNDIRSFGATTLQYPGVLDMVHDYLGNDFYVVPSSTHEVIIVPKEQSLSPKELGETIREINETQVEREEVLADHAYEYSGEDKKLTILKESMKQKEMDMVR